MIGDPGLQQIRAHIEDQIQMSNIYVTSGPFYQHGLTLISHG